MMMMSCGERNNIRYPFTASQWQELEQQALVFKYMVSGMPIPPDLIFTVRTSLDSSLSSKLLLHQSPQLGWNGYQIAGFGRKIDPEPGRCRRTDGKKWRCSKDAYPDSKYCERHMHRGRNRSRKPVENNNNNISSPKTTEKSAMNNLSTTPFSSSQDQSINNNISTKFFLDSNDYTYSPYKPYSHGNGDGLKRESDDKHGIFSGAQLGFSLSQLKENNKAYSYYSSSSSSAGLGNHYYNNIGKDNTNNINVNDQPSKKVMHHFLDEWSPKDNDNTQLSMSIPNSSLHDFFMTQK
ncbi:hypothetical protein CASFOL_030757 [Castilleja foliolosa]|uniref:Growth-regulating factor n=1 Tax=Castilleja foliolosa TaxID=1961234 RepID=A0ABD3C686_9LAMI